MLFLGLILMNLKMFEKAIRYFDKAIEINENFSAAYNNKGLVLHIIKSYELALTYFNKSIELNP
jgi:tetratricopeptide (TPR) repeat protein